MGDIPWLADNVLEQWSWNSYSIHCYGAQQTPRSHFPPSGMCGGNKPNLSVTVSGSCWPLINWTSVALRPQQAWVSSSAEKLNKHPSAQSRDNFVFVLLMKYKESKSKVASGVVFFFLQLRQCRSVWAGRVFKIAGPELLPSLPRLKQGSSHFR